MGFLRDISPKRAIGDLALYIREERPYKLAFLAGSIVPMVVLTSAFILDGNAKSKPPPPTIIYAEFWPEDRSMADILRDQKIRQQAKTIAMKRKQESYRRIGRALGMDVEAIEADAKRIREQSERDAQKQPSAPVN